ncbi:MAG: Ig-like domain-containing protein [Alphaproteobacteria bacterium]|nr:Ig-like domain-containing protein [Alphaproteobacteria bacterium]
MTLLLALAPVALANGQTTHAWITAHALAHLPEGELRDLLTDEALQPMLYNGAMFPDGGYAVDDDYGELAHWEPFQTAYRDWILEHHPPPFTDTGAQHVAFLMGLASHGMADQTFDAMFMQLSRQYDAEAGWAEGDSLDEASDVVYASILGPWEPPEPWFPGELFVQLYADDFGHSVTVGQMEDGQDLLGAAIAFVGLASEYPASVDRYTAQFPWAAEHIADGDMPGSPPCEGAIVARYWQQLWDTLNGTATLDPPLMATVPEDGGMGHEQRFDTGESRVHLVFKRGLSRDTVNTDTITVAAADGTPHPVEVELFYGQDSHVVNLHPLEDWAPDTDYVVTVHPGIVSFDGLSLGTQTMTFSTTPPPDPPDDTPPDDEPGGRCSAAPGAGWWALLGVLGLARRRRVVAGR